MSLNAWGWNTFFEEEFSKLGLPGTPARVIFSSRGSCRITTGEGEIGLPLGDVQAVVGDWLVYHPAAGGLPRLLPRRTQVSRKAPGPGMREQVLAANVDTLFIVTGLDGDFSLRRLQRYLVLAAQSGASPVIVLNKSDLCEEVLARAAGADRLTQGRVPVVLLSALDAGSVAQLHRFVEPGATAVLLGSSGVGKSTIVNALLGEERQGTGEVRTGDSHGRHTTTGRHLFRVPSGWLLIDTPGLRELEPWAPPEAVSGVFSDIEELAVECRFRDCSHRAEPGCAVTAAVKNGLLEAGRVENYIALTRDLQRQMRMRDAHAALEEKRRWKIIHRAVRRMPDKRG